VRPTTAPGGLAQLALQPGGRLVTGFSPLRRDLDGLRSEREQASGLFERT
jgi:hypothetical protein